MISSPLLNGGAGPKLIKEKNDVHFNTEFNTKSKTLKSCSKVLKFGQMIKKVTRNNNLRSCENKRTFHNMIINIYLQFLFCIQSSGSIFRHRSGKHFEREIYTTNLDLQKKRYLNYLNENQIMNVQCGCHTSVKKCFQQLLHGLRILKSFQVRCLLSVSTISILTIFVAFWFFYYLFGVSSISAKYYFQVNFNLKLICTQKKYHD